MRTPRVHPAKKTKWDVEFDRYVTMQTHITRFTGMRIYHCYRNTSRAAKRYLMGDKVLEQLFILTLKEHFFRPFRYRAPIENTPYLGRSFADLMDRHYALFAQNQHPLQLDMYEEYNKLLRNLHNREFREHISDLKDRFQTAREEHSKHMAKDEGESLSTDELTQIYMKVVMARYREKETFQMNTKTKTGEINDYLEVRRPFGANEQ